MDRIENIIGTIKLKFSNNRKVAENYFFMTLLLGVGTLISLVLYPYLIRILGKECYGMYVFIYSNIQFFILFISFGFDMPALKKVSQNPDSETIKNRTLSELFTAKTILFCLCAIVLLLFMRFIPFVKDNRLIYSFIFLSSAGEILFPQWYFQALQKMKFVTYVNLTLRLLTIPLIFLFIKSPADLLIYTIITSSLPIVGGIFAFLYLVFKKKSQIRFVSFRSLKSLFAEALPFFWTSALGTVKQEMLTFITGTFFSMDKVAILDLANKIIAIPRLVTNRINIAIFPEFINKISTERIRRIFRYETIIGLVVTGCIAIFGYWAVLILGGKSMLAAYPAAVILSFTVYTWLIVGCYVNFLFVPQNRYYFIAKNQFVALISFFIFAAIALLIAKNIILLIAAYVLSHVVEIIYCKYLIKKHQLL